MRTNKIPFTLLTFALVAVGACSSSVSGTGATTGSAECQGANCAPSGVGVACTLGDETSPGFPGYGATEVNIEDHTSECTTGICIAANFQGRVSCPYGGSDCTTPAGAPVTVDVKPQLISRPPSDAVYCSCHCDGPAGTGPFCACPSGFECSPLVADIGVGQRNLAGSYCIKAGTAVTNPTSLASGPTCDKAAHNCDDR